MTSLSEYERTSGVVHSLGYHLVWCPKYRKRVLIGNVAVRLKELVKARAFDNKWAVEALEIFPDHVHLFVRCAPDASPSRVANQFKGYTSRELRKEFPHLRSVLPTLWSRSYFVASVGSVSDKTIRRYIEEQSTKPTVGVP